MAKNRKKTRGLQSGIGGPSTYKEPTPRERVERAADRGLDLLPGLHGEREPVYRQRARARSPSASTARGIAGDKSMGREE